MSGSGTVYRTTITSSDPSTTGTTKRTVSDRIAELWPEAAPMFTMTAKGVTKDGKVSGKGLIGKEATDNMKFEWFTFTPFGIVFTVATYSSATELTLSSVDGLTAGMTLVDLTNMTTCIIDALTVATCTLTTTSIGATAWSSAVGRKLLAMAPTYKQASTDPAEITKDENHAYNYLYIYRRAVSIAKTAATDSHYGKEAYWDRLKRRSFHELMRAVENSVMFMERASSGGYTSTSNLGNVFSTRGAWGWSQNSYDCGGVMTKEEFLKDLPLSFHESVSTDDELIMICGRHIFADVQSWWWDDMQLTRQGMYEALGMKTYNILTSGNRIHIVLSNAFDQVGNQTRALIFKPSELTMMHKNNADMQIEKDIQDNDEHAYRDGIWGTIGLKSDDGGYSITRVTNWITSGAI